jgi:hypothetical protein
MAPRQPHSERRYRIRVRVTQLFTRARIETAAQAVFFVAGAITLAVGIGHAYAPAGLIAAGVEAILAGAYLRGGTS